MYQELSTGNVADQLRDFEVFSCYSACLRMAEWLEELEECTGQPMQLDPIAIRCEFCFDDLNGFAQDYSEALNASGLSVTEQGFYDNKAAIIEWFSDRTTFIHVHGNHYIKGEL
jgi:hypothetical protein